MINLEALIKKDLKIPTQVPYRSSNRIRIMVLENMTSNPVPRALSILFFDFLLEHVYMRPEVNSNWFEISKRFDKSFRLNGDFTMATCK